MPACNCCSEPPCAVSIECDSVSASGSKTACGAINPDDGLRYLTVVTTVTSSRDESIADYGGVGGTYSDVSTTSSTDTTTYTENPCASSVVYAGTSTRTQTVFIPDYDPADYNWSSQCDGTRNATTGAWTGTYTVTENGVVIDSGVSSAPCDDHGIDSNTVFSNPYVEETTAALIARAVAALPAYPDTWGGSCSAVKNLASDESSYTLRRFKWRLKHAPTGTCYLKAWLQSRFVPETGAEVITPLTPYEWSGSGNPCFTDDTKPPDHEDNEILGADSEQMEPSTDGETFIEIVKFSCVEGYDPPDDGTANGFPVPA